MTCTSIHSYEILCHEDGTTVLDFGQFLTHLSLTANLEVSAVPHKKPAAKVQQCNRIKSMVITGEALPLPLQLRPIL
jgi:hypothetical protein